MDHENDLDCWITDEIVCPLCKHKFSDSWEYELDGDDSTEVECENCGKDFLVTISVTVNYTSKPITDEYWDRLARSEASVERMWRSNGSFDLADRYRQRSEVYRMYRRHPVPCEYIDRGLRGPR